LNQYIFLLHERPADDVNLSAAQMQEIVARYSTWARSLAERGLLAGGEKLADHGGRHLRLKDGRPLATDGPYAEAHDVIGGFFIVKAENDEAAQALALECPHLRGARWIEIRRIEGSGG
jgi:hypothetical protein